MLPLLYHAAVTALMLLRDTDTSLSPLLVTTAYLSPPYLHVIVTAAPAENRVDDMLAFNVTLRDTREFAAIYARAGIECMFGQAETVATCCVRVGNGGMIIIHVARVPEAARQRAQH